MRFNTMQAAATVIAMAGLTSCTDGPAPGGPALDDERTSTAEQESLPWRNDQSGIIIPGQGFWGSWYQRTYCNPRSWAVGYRMRVEGSQGGGDDTALNSVQLLCKDSVTGATEWISSFDGLWGSWHSSASCSGPGNYLRGAAMRIEGSQGGSDDTAANDVQFSCSSSAIIHAPGGQGWGSWGSWSSCPEKSAVCGLSIRFESSQGGGDDTAMNGLELECCDLSCNSNCGDGVCDTNCETPQSCPGDCGYCGDHSCSQFENSSSCPQDCVVCGDGVCNGGETPSSCPEDCGYCGDGLCRSGETSVSCPEDCGASCYIPSCQA